VQDSLCGRKIELLYNGAGQIEVGKKIAVEGVLDPAFSVCGKVHIENRLSNVDILRADFSH